MTDNVHKYGFRWWTGNKGQMPALEWHTVATGQDHQDDSSTSILIRPGDPLKLVSTGGVNVAKADEKVYGICMAIGPVWDGTAMVKRRTFPNQNAWGTVEERRPWIGLVPATAGIWEIDVDEATTFTTYAGYIDAIGENCEHVCPGSATVDPAGRVANPMLDISDNATTAAHGWRIVGISPTKENRDFSGAYVKLLVKVNDSEEAGMPATNVTAI